MLLNVAVRVFVAAAVITLIINPAASAVGFSEPPPISNKQKAHFNISFTGGGGSSSENACAVQSGTIGAVSKDFSLGTDPIERRVALIGALMSEYGLTAEQAAGPVGNFMQESGGEHLPPDVNQNDTTGAPPNSSLLGYGWAQWSGGRKTAFANFLSTNGYTTSDGRATDAGDFAYLKNDLTGPSYASTIVDLKKQTSPEDAALSFHTTFERSGDTAAQITERSTSARKAFGEYTAAQGGGSGSNGCGETLSSVDFGEVAFPLKGSKKVVNNPEMFSDGTTSMAEHPYKAYDIMANGGTPVRAFISGEVSYLFNDTCGGDSVTIWNKDVGIGISYMHMNRGDVLPAIGQRVGVGEIIGAVGTWNGGCGGDHLHIDASTDRIRQPCSREDPAACAKIESHFRPMGKELFDTYQTLPEN